MAGKLEWMRWAVIITVFCSCDITHVDQKICRYHHTSRRSKHGCASGAWKPSGRPPENQIKCVQQWAETIFARKAHSWERNGRVCQRQVYAFIHLNSPRSAGNNCVKFVQDHPAIVWVWPSWNKYNILLTYCKEEKQIGSFYYLDKWSQLSF